MFEVWFLRETVDLAGSSRRDCLNGCHAISSSLLDISKLQPGKNMGGNRSMDASGKYPAWHEHPGIMPVEKNTVSN